MSRWRQSLLALAVGAPLAASAPEATVLYQSDFGKGHSEFHEVFHYYGAVQLARDDGRPGPSGAPSLRLQFEYKTKTMVGASLPLRAGQRIRVSLSSAADLTACVSPKLCLKARDTNGKKVDWITFGDVPRDRDFGTLKSGTVELAPSTEQADLFVFAEDVTGTVWLSDLRVEEVRFPPEIESAMSAHGPTTWGINDFFGFRYTRNPSLSDTCAKLMAAAGFTEARLAVWWGSRDQLENDIQPGGWICLDRKDGKYDFSELDRQIDELARYGVKPGAVIVHGTPEWASGKTRDDVPEDERQNWRALRRPFFPPRDWGDYETFVAQLVSHFRERVRIWEVGNEPNTPDSGFRGGHRGYAEYLRHFHIAAKRTDPKCTVLCGRVGGRWLTKMLADDPSLAQHFDGVVSHPYADTPQSSLSDLRREQLAMADRGVMKPMYVTEIGYGQWHKAASPSEYEDAKARKAAAALPLLATVSNHVYWWTSVRPGNQHGLLRDDGYCYRPMPAYWEAAKATGRLAQATGPVTATVEVPDGSVAKRQEFAITLAATNESPQPQQIRFWPVGFVSSLGASLDEVRRCEWNGTLPAGAKHTATLRFRVSPDAEGGTFPVGLAVICSEGNSLSLTDLHVPSIASTSRMSASCGNDPQNLAALNDHVLPLNSWDLANLYFAWPDREGTTEWVQFDFAEPRVVCGVEVYWLDTTKRRQNCRVPKSWRVLYREGGQWRPAAGVAEYGVALDQLNRALFTPVETTALRLEARLQDGANGGIHEWRVLAEHAGT